MSRKNLLMWTALFFSLAAIIASTVNMYFLNAGFDKKLDTRVSDIRRDIADIFIALQLNARIIQLKQEIAQENYDKALTDLLAIRKNLAEVSKGNGGTSERWRSIDIELEKLETNLQVKNTVSGDLIEDVIDKL